MKRLLSFLSIPVLISTAFSGVVFAEDRSAFYSNNAIIFYNENADAGVCSPNGVHSGSPSTPVNLPSSTLQQLESGGWKEKAEKNKAAYLAGEAKTGIPWTVLATVHYREASMDPGRSIANGEPITGLRYKSMDGQTIGATLEDEAELAAGYFKEKAKLFYSIDLSSSSSIEDWGSAFLGYNRGFMYRNWNKTFQDSPYVMNGYDEAHLNMKWIDADSYERPGGNKYNNLSGSTETRPGALAMLAFLGGPSGSISCKNGGVVAGNILETAKALAWDYPIENFPRGTNWESKAKPEFVEAVKKHNPGPASWGGGVGYADCGVFVATVMKASGADSDFPSSGTSNIIRYLRSSPKYQVDNNPSQSTLQPGDILIYDNNGNGHVEFFGGDLGTGKNGEKLIIIDASQEKRPPSFRDATALQYMFKMNAISARLAK